MLMSTTWHGVIAASTVFLKDHQLGDNLAAAVLIRIHEFGSVVSSTHPTLHHDLGLCDVLGSCELAAKQVAPATGPSDENHGFSEASMTVVAGDSTACQGT